jgi:hypothetical protein
VCWPIAIPGLGVCKLGDGVKVGGKVAAPGSRVGVRSVLKLRLVIGVDGEWLKLVTGVANVVSCG